MKAGSSVLAGLWILLVLSGCVHAPDGPASAGGSAFVNLPPLDQALTLLGKDRNSFVLPKSEESYYRLVARFPLIDEIAGNPFSLPEFSKMAADRISETTCAKGVIDAARQMILSPPFEPETGWEEDDPDTLNQPAHLTGFSSETRDIVLPMLSRLCAEMTRIHRDCLTARQQLTTEEVDWIRQDIGKYFYEQGFLRFLTGPVDTQMKVVQIARKVDLQVLMDAQTCLAAAADSAVKGILPVSENLVPIDGQILYDETYPWGRVLVGGTGRNHYDRDAALILDLGGDDSYISLSEIPPDYPVSLVLDLSGDDTYRSDRPISQGSGCLGIGILMDLEGNDCYRGNNYSQGTGFIGFGLLWDAGGDDQYRAGYFAQGAGLFGGGILVDQEGADTYRIDSMGQGFGSTLGYGILHDGAGADHYLATSELYGFAQGSGCGCRSYPWFLDWSLYGGAGMLVDDEGDDVYEAGSFVQGGSYFLSLGILVDRKGNDYYAGKGSYSHGAGVHLTNAFFMDESGDDIYCGDWAGTAAGNDRSAGFFFDGNGDDFYAGKNGDGQGYSHKPLGLSVFVDSTGNDIYRAPDYSQGYVLPPITPDNWGDVIFIDSGGHDQYSMPHRGDNLICHEQRHAVCLDTVSNRTGLFPENQGEFPVEQCPFLHFQKTGDIIIRYGKNLPALFQELVRPDDLDRRAVEEAITLAILDRDTDVVWNTSPAIGLKSPDPKTRAFTAMTVDIHEIQSMLPALIRHTDDPDSHVRKLIYRALGNLKTDDAAPILEERIHRESDPVCRGYAVTALGKSGTESAEETLMDVLRRDSHEYPRMTAAYALARLQSFKAVESLRAACSDPSPYVRKAAGEALLQLNIREGVFPLVDYLKFRALDTSSDNYGSNIGAVLMEYTNVNLGRDVDAWRDWIRKEGETFDLSANLQARNQYLEAVKLRRKNDLEGAMAAFNAALKANPDYAKARIDYAAILNELAWNLVTGSSETADLKEGLDLARRCVELDRQAMYLDTLAEACYRNGWIQEAIEHQTAAVELDPDTAEYKDRLNIFRKKLP
jgi:tetratricopeptide (TPR) repeat protein